MSNQESLKQNLLTIASETFRFERVFKKAISKLEIEDQNKYISQFAWFTKRVNKALDDSGLHLVNIEGQIYNPGMAVTPLNIEDFEPNDILYIKQMMEPVIMDGDSVVKTGTVILGRKEK